MRTFDPTGPWRDPKIYKYFYKLECIDYSGCSSVLTKGRVYNYYTDHIFGDVDMVFIKCDDNDYHSVNSSRFIDISDAWNRNEKLESILRR